MEDRNGYVGGFSIANGRLPVCDEMSKEVFDAMMAAGLAQAKEGQSVPVDEAFSDLLEKLSGEM